MIRFRSILSLILVCVTTLLVSCGNANVAKAPPTYTPQLVAELQRYAAPIEKVRDRLPELGNYIQQRDWNNVESFIHGPLGELRHDMSYIARTVLPQEQKSAKSMLEDISAHFERIDAAAKEGYYGLALENYNEVVSDLETFLSIVPSRSEGA